MEAVILYQSCGINTNHTVNQTGTKTAEMTALYGIDFLLIGMAFLLNKLGIVLLLKAKTCGINNQNVLLVHLSFVSILCLCLISAGLFWKSNHVQFPNWYITLFYVTSMAYLCNLLAMIIDRLLFVLLRMKYSIVITKTVIVMMIVIIWVVAVSCGAVYSKLKNLTIKDRENASHIYNGLFMTISVVSYFIIELDLLRSPPTQRYEYRNSKMPDRKEKRKGGIQRRKYLTTFVIVLPFFFLSVLPSFILESLEKEMSYFDILTVVFLGVNVTNYLIVPIIYIFTQPKVRELFDSFFTRTKSYIHNKVNYDEEESLERERLLVKSIYDGTNPTFGSIM